MSATTAWPFRLVDGYVGAPPGLVRRAYHEGADPPRRGDEAGAQESADKAVSMFRRLGGGWRLSAVLLALGRVDEASAWRTLPETPCTTGVAAPPGAVLVPAALHRLRRGRRCSLAS